MSAVAPARPRRGPLALLLAALIGSLAAAVLPAPDVARAASATTTTALNLRGGPSTNDPVILVMPGGSPVSVDGGPQNGFYQVTYNGTAGLAFGDFLDQDGTSGGNDGGTSGGGASGAATVAVNALNLRAGPSTNDQVLAVMARGAGVTLTGETSNGFAGVTYNGTSGWAFADYLSAGGSAPPAPTPDDGGGTNGGGTAGNAKVAVNALNLRAGASTNDRVLATMSYGADVTLTGQRANGFAAVTYNGTAGWAYEAYLSSGGAAPAPDPAPAPTPAPNPDPGTTPGAGSGVAVTTTALNLRAGASTSAAILTVMPAGAQVALTGVAENGFYYVNYNGTLGWASTSYLTLGGSPSPAPNPGGGSSTDQIIQIIYDAADRYGQSREDMLRVARCESNLLPTAVNPAGSYGLFQFVPSTWASTPYAAYDIFDPWASANAAGWMWSVGRRNEWVCQ